MADVVQRLRDLDLERGVARHAERLAALVRDPVRLPANLTRQAPSTSSITSGAPVLKVSVDGRITPTLFLVPSASSMLCETHLPSKYTLARVLIVAVR